MSKLTSLPQDGHRDGTITPRQFETLQFLRDFQRDNGYSASIRDVADSFGVQVNVIVGLIDRLIKAEVISHKPRISRSFVITKLGHEALASDAPVVVAEPREAILEALADLAAEDRPASIESVTRRTRLAYGTVARWRRWLIAEEVISEDRWPLGKRGPKPRCQVGSTARTAGGAE